MSAPRFTRKEVVGGLARAVVTASISFTADMVAEYGHAIEREESETASWVCEMLLANAKVAEDKSYALCDDTGTPHVFVEIGERCVLPAGWMRWILEGIKQGMASVPTRPMAVRGDAGQRVGQELGLYDEPEKLVPGSFLVDTIPGERVRVTVLMLGGGPELRAKTYRIFHHRSLESLLNEVAEWGAEMMPKLGCTPATLAVGIGRTHFEASSLVLKAMKEGSLPVQTRWESLLTQLINETGVGPLGVGGSTTILGSFIQIGHQRASGFRVVSVRPCCCMEPRKATIEFEAGGSELAA